MMRPQVWIFLLLYALSYGLTGMVAIVFQPTSLANFLGLLALIGYLTTLLPSLLGAVFPAIKRHKSLIWLLKYRRHLGIAAYALAMNHGILLIIQRQLNLLDWQTYLHYFQGFSSITIFTILAITSNDESVKSLKKDWKKLHKLTYLVLLIMPWHILDKMAGHWTYLTPLAVLLTFATVMLFLYRQALALLPSRTTVKPSILQGEATKVQKFHCKSSVMPLNYLDESSRCRPQKMNNGA
jgi:sulfoxide reductase heme-binding subunit YedZ